MGLRRPRSDEQHAWNHAAADVDHGHAEWNRTDSESLTQEIFHRQRQDGGHGTGRDDEARSFSAVHEGGDRAARGLDHAPQRETDQGDGRQVAGMETLKMPYGTLEALRLVRQEQKQFDQRVELWMSPSLEQLPVRIRITQTSGDQVDLLLRSKAPPNASP